MAVDHNDPKTVYAVAKDGVFRSTTWGTTWQLLPWSFVNPTLVVVSPSDSQTIFVGTQASGLYFTHNGGATWTQASLNGAAGNPIALAINPNNSSNIEMGMTASPRAGGGVLVSWDGGATFRPDNAGLASAASLSPTYVWAIRFNPASSHGTAAVATSNGIYVSSNPPPSLYLPAAKVWKNISGNAVPRLFTGLCGSGSYLYASTYGEGVIRTIRR